MGDSSGNKLISEQNFSHIGEVIRFWRNKVGLTQDELGQRIGVLQQQVARIESGKVSPSFYMIQRMIEEMGMEFSISLKIARPFRKHIVEYRKTLGIRREDMCKREKVDYSCVSNFENGRRSLFVDTLVRIGKGLGLDVGFVHTLNFDNKKVGKDEIGRDDIFE